MARLELPVTRALLSGLGESFIVANADGHSVANNGRMFLRIENNSPTLPSTVTIDLPRRVDGQDVIDPSFVMITNSQAVIGPFPPSTYNQRGDSGAVIHVDFSSISEVRLQAIGF